MQRNKNTVCEHGNKWGPAENNCNRTANQGVTPNQNQNQHQHRGGPRWYTGNKATAERGAAEHLPGLERLPDLAALKNHYVDPTLFQ